MSHCSQFVTIFSVLFEDNSKYVWSRRSSGKNTKKKRSERIVDTIEISDSGSDSDDKKKRIIIKESSDFTNFF